MIQLAITRQQSTVQSKIDGPTPIALIEAALVAAALAAAAEWAKVSMMMKSFVREWCAQN